MASDPLVNLEVCLECDVKEILPNGNEVYIEPPTFSDKISLNNIKIVNDGTISENYHVNKLEGIRKDLKLAHQEVLVLRDFLSISSSKDKNYISFSNLPNSSNNPRNNVVFDFYSRKYALEKAQSTLMEGYYKLTSSKMAGKLERNYDILKLRDNWSLRKSKEGIVGDLDFNEDILTGTMNKATSFKIESTSERGLSVSLPHGLKYNSLLKISLDKDSLLTVDLISVPVEEAADPSIVLARAQNVVFFQKVFKLLAGEGNSIKTSSQVGNKLLLELNTSFSSKDLFLFRTLEFAISLIFMHRLSNSINNTKNEFLLTKINIFTKNCLHRQGLLDHLITKQFSDNLKITHVCDHCESLHCVRIQLTLSLTKVPHQNKIYVEISQGTMNVITVRGKVLGDLTLSQIDKLIDQEALMYKYEILALVARKFGFYERSPALVESWERLRLMDGDELFAFHKKSTDVLFVLNGGAHARVFVVSDSTGDAVQMRVDGGFIGDFIVRIESVFIKLIN